MNVKTGETTTKNQGLYIFLHLFLTNLVKVLVSKVINQKVAHLKFEVPFSSLIGPFLL